MNRLARRASLAVAAALTAAALTGCSDDPVTYRPAAYGEVVDGVGRCYWTDNLGEAYLLLAAGLCPAGWVPYSMPDAWHETYWAYYASDDWIEHFVPLAQRTRYRTVYVAAYQRGHAAQITARSQAAVWKGSNGKTTTGSSKVTFPSGRSPAGAYAGSGTSARSDSSSGQQARPRPAAGTRPGTSSGTTRRSSSGSGRR